MAAYAEISRWIGECLRLTDLSEQNALAALLFTWSLPCADADGILPHEPQAYKARIAPALTVSHKTIAQCIEAQIAAGLLRPSETGLAIHRDPYHWRLRADRPPSTPTSISCRLQIIERDGPRCSYCGYALTPEQIHIDHRVPRSRGGSDDPSNLCVACATCNRRKGAKSETQFRQELSEAVRCNGA